MKFRRDLQSALTSIVDPFPKCDGAGIAIWIE